MKRIFKNDKIIKKIILITMLIILILSNILIGAPVNNNATIINIIVTLVAMIFIIFKISKKERMIKDKIDLLVLILCLSPAIPIIFNTYITLSGSINYLLRYIMIFFIYIIFKDISKEYPKTEKYLINITIISAVFLTIIGLDKMSTNVFLPYIKAINSWQVEYEETRMDSLFSYANTFAAFLSFSLFLVIGKYLDTEKKKFKIIYATFIFILLTGIILSYSRSIFIFLAIMFILFIIMLKDKEMILKTIIILTITGAFSILYSCLFGSFLTSGNFILIWTMFLVINLISGVIVLIVDKYTKNMTKVKNKYYVVGLFSIFIVISTIVIVGLNFKEPLIMFNTSNAKNKITKEIYQVQGNSNYTFEFDIESKTKYKNSNIFKITIIEKNKYFDNIKETSIDFSNYSGKKEIKLKTDEDTKEIFIIFTSEMVNEETYLKVNRLLVNGKEEILKYKYLPTTLISKVKNINLNTKSAWERGVFILDGIKLIKNNILFGIGGEGWKYMQGDVQEYYYATTEVHSYPIQIFLEFGIVGFFSLVGILYYFIKGLYKYLKEKTENNDVKVKSIIVAILLIFLHSCMDFDMSFLCVLLTMFAFLGVESNKVICSLKNNRSKNIVNYIMLILLIPLLIINIFNHIVEKKLYILKNENNIDKAYEILSGINKYPSYSLDVKKVNIELNELYSRIHNVNKNKCIVENGKYILKYEKRYNTVEVSNILINIYLDEENTHIEELLEISEIALNSKLKNRYNVSEILERENIFLELAEKMRKTYDKTKQEDFLEMSNKFYEKIISEYNQNRDTIKNHIKCRYNKLNQEFYINKIKEIYEEAIRGRSLNEYISINISL